MLPNIEIILAEPRGFCAGVTRAIETVERALIKFGSPIYVKHEIVHNKIIVEDFKKRGVIFIENIEDAPNKAVVIFSAHGVSQKVEEDAKQHNMLVIDATCPLVSKVHKQAKKYEQEDYEIILIGHKSHPEVDGTSGRVKKPVILVSNKNDARKIKISKKKIGYISQTTLSTDDTKEIVDILKKRFPVLQNAVATKDICYATQNRQDAVKSLIQEEEIEILIVIGSKNSSNSNRLKDLGRKFGIDSFLIDNAESIDKARVLKCRKIGITAGASAPEFLITEVVTKIKLLFSNRKISIKSVSGKKENISFILPKEVRRLEK